MEVKKNPKYDTRRYSQTFFLSGLLFSLVLTLGAFEWTRHVKEEKVEAAKAGPVEMEELPDITKQNEPPPPAPPPPPPATVEVVEDDVETPDADIPDTDPDDKPYVPTQGPPPSDEEPEKTDEQEIFEVVEDPPTYPGGEEARQKFIAKHLVYPPLAVENQKQGTVHVQFVVEPDGSLSNVRAVKTFDEDCAREAERVVRMMKWTPGKQRNKPVRVKVSMPIKFRLQ